MKNLAALVAEAEAYARAYAAQYRIADLAIVRALYITHLAYLLNQPG